ncbi:MAG: glycosyltransferase family 39 protein [bacterium]|nr:glycosyltransferase family 39 protein [bacterium]
MVVVALSLIVRLTAVMAWGNSDLRGTTDQISYFALAQNVLLHHTFSYGQPRRWIDEAILDAPGPYDPTAARAPLYPLVIAALWWGDKPPVLEVWLAQVVFGALVAMMVYLMALQAFGFGAALVAGLAVALGPFTAYITALFLSETLFTFLLTTSLWFWTRKSGVMAGVLLGAATLTRAVSLPLVGVVLLLGLLTKTNRTLHLKVALVALAVIAPWTIRNAITQHAFIPVASVGWGANMLLGTIDVPYGTGSEWITYRQDKGFSEIAGTVGTPPHEAEKQMGALAAERIRQDPLHWLWLRVKQAPRFWLGSGDMISMQPTFKYAYRLGALVFWALAVAGMFLARQRWRELYPLALVPVLLALAHSTGSVEERYSLALVPAAAIFAGHAVSVLAARTFRP